MNISIISTSPRKKSNSLRFSKYLQSLVKDAGIASVELVDFETYDVPFFGQGYLNKNHLSTFQSTLIASWEKADLIFIVMPEYNWFPDAEFINLLNQLGGKDFAHLFGEKTFALAGVSSGRGGKLPAIEMTTMLGKLINFLNQYSVISPRIYESHETAINVDENGNATGNEVYNTTVKAFVEYSIEVAKRWKKN
ncbi:NADPH-dependent FMN reductase [Flectobacillus major]|jgi:chromate reductase|uniref:NADPH-dependent FMN reductase n=1 Tax=Flectobacillus major TaxID=103 RepID=UPI0005C71DB1|nr:NAD(P)H-dependent oxidoreductase [Flectobacillus major]